MGYRKWYLKPCCFAQLFRYIFFLKQKSTLAYRNSNNLKRLNYVLRWTWTICFNICLILYKREKIVCDYNLSRVIWLIFYSVLIYQLLTITNLNTISSGWPNKPTQLFPIHLFVTKNMIMKKPCLHYTCIKHDKVFTLYKTCLQIIEFEWIIFLKLFLCKEKSCMGWALLQMDSCTIYI